MPRKRGECAVARLGHCLESLKRATSRGTCALSTLLCVHAPPTDGQGMARHVLGLRRTVCCAAEAGTCTRRRRCPGSETGRRGASAENHLPFSFFFGGGGGGIRGHKAQARTRKS